MYKVKLDFVLEQLASASVGGCGQEVCFKLVEEARNNLAKIAVSVAMLCLQIVMASSLTLWWQLNHLFAGWAIRGWILSQSPVANIWDGREDAEPRCLTVLVLTNPRGPGETGNILQPAQCWEFQVNSKFACITDIPIIYHWYFNTQEQSV